MRLGAVAARTPVGLLLLVLAAAAVVFVADGVRIVRFPFPVDYGEGPLLAQTLRLGHLEGIYRSDLSSPPYTVSNYPPLYPLVLSPLARLYGPAFWYGRLLSWLAVGSAGLLIGLILHVVTRDPIAAAIGGLSLLAFPPVYYWSSLYRVDALALALSLGGIALCVWRPDGRWMVPWAALLLTAAVYTRQSYGLAAPLAACLWLAQTGRWRRGLALAGVSATLGAMAFVGLELATRGGFSFNIVAANLNHYQTGSVGRYAVDVATQMPLALIAAALFLLTGGWFAVPSWRLIAPYLAGALVSGLTIGKVGSNVNYLIELSAAMSLTVGAFLAWQRPRWWAHAMIALLLALDVALMVAASPYRTVTHARLRHGEEAERLLRVIHQARGVVLADEDMGLLVLDGRPLYLQPFEMTQLARSGRWDQRAFVSAIERQAFATILIYRIPGLPLHRERWTDEMLQAIQHHYVVEDRVGQTDVYRPRAGGSGSSISQNFSSPLMRRVPWVKKAAISRSRATFSSRERRSSTMGERAKSNRTSCRTSR
jgi:hypothetical protein